jgi:hypothetical protein
VWNIFPELKKFYTSNAGDNTIGVVDLKRMKVIKKLKTESKPDGSAYAAPFHKLYVSDECSKAKAIVDMNKDEIIKTLRFDSETGMPQYDPVSGQSVRKSSGPEYLRRHRSGHRRKGFRHLGFSNDLEINAAEWIVYDALYAYCGEMVRRRKLAVRSKAPSDLARGIRRAIETQLK